MSLLEKGFILKIAEKQKEGNPMEKQSIGKTIYVYRKKQGLTQEKLAEQIGVTPGAVSKWETGASLPDVMLLAPIARALKISANTLLSFQKELGEKERKGIKEKATTLFLQGGYEAGKAFLKEKNREYPEDTSLKMTTAHLRQMYLFTAVTLPEKEKDFLIEERKEIMALFQQVVDSGDKNYYYIGLFSLAGLQMEEENYEEAEKNLKKLGESAVDPYPLWTFLLLREEKYDEALLMGKRNLLNHVFQSVTMLSAMGKASLEKEDEEKALFYFAGAAHLEDFFAMGLGSPLERKAHIYLHQGNKEKSAESFLAYVTKFLESPRDYHRHPYFDGLLLENKEQTQKEMRQKMARSILEEKGWKELIEMAD